MSDEIIDIYLTVNNDLSTFSTYISTSMSTMWILQDMSEDKNFLLESMFYPVFNNSFPPTTTTKIKAMLYLFIIDSDWE